jgi:hypothetical protein
VPVGRGCARARRDAHVGSAGVRNDAGYLLIAMNSHFAFHRSEQRLKEEMELQLTCACEMVIADLPA